MSSGRLNNTGVQVDAVCPVLLIDADTLLDGGRVEVHPVATNIESTVTAATHLPTDMRREGNN